jgi:FixJ family two-component response regulator
MSDAKIGAPTIAIIDDDESVRATTSSLVRSLGFDVAVFRSAEDYLQSSQLHSASCLISDVQMPGMSGLDLQSHLAAQGHQVPIIFITAFPHSNVEQRARDAGAVCVLNKPFDGSALVECIERALRAIKPIGGKS